MRDTEEQLAALDGLIARKARKLEREARELRALVRQRQELASDTTDQEDTDVKQDSEEAGTRHAHAAA